MQLPGRQGCGKCPAWPSGSAAQAGSHWRCGSVQSARSSGASLLLRCQPVHAAAPKQLQMPTILSAPLAVQLFSDVFYLEGFSKFSIRATSERCKPGYGCRAPL